MLAQQVNLLATYANLITLVSLHMALHRSIIFYLDVGRSLGDLRAARRSKMPRCPCNHRQAAGQISEKMEFMTQA